jgi:hypothetical protein
MELKLGKKAFVKDERDLMFRNYVKLPELPAPPIGHGNTTQNWGMLGNDKVGDCVIAGADHETILWTTEGQKPATFTDDNAISDYSSITGYNPNDPNSDQGTNVRDALNYRRNNGMIDSTRKRHKIGAYVALNSFQEVLEALYLFDVVGIGIQFPSSAMDQFKNGQPWTVVEGSKVEGGHYVPVVYYDGTWIYVITWGKLQKMSVDFYNKYCDESWAILSQEFLNSSGESPEGFNLSQLQADLSSITSI